MYNDFPMKTFLIANTLSALSGVALVVYTTVLVAQIL